MKVVPLGKEPIRAIKVLPFDRDRSHWHAIYEGDEWTRPIGFKPMRGLGIFLPVLEQWPGRCGLPIVIIDHLDTEVAA